MNRVQQIRQWDWRTLLYPQYFCHIEEIVDGNPIEDERIPKNKSPDCTRKQNPQNELKVQMSPILT